MRFSHVFIHGGGRVEEGVEAGLAIDHNVTFTGKVDDHVRLLPALISIDDFLFDEIAFGGKAGEFDEAAEGDFAPLAADRRTRQGRHQLRGLRVECSLGLGKRAELLAQHAVGFDAGFFDLADAKLILIHEFAHGLEQGVDLLLPLVERSGRLGRQRGETFLG